MAREVEDNHQIGGYYSLRELNLVLWVKLHMVGKEKGLGF